MGFFTCRSVKLRIKVAEHEPVSSLAGYTHTHTQTESLVLSIPAGRPHPVYDLMLEPSPCLAHASLEDTGSSREEIGNLISTINSITQHLPLHRGTPLVPLTDRPWRGLHSDDGYWTNVKSMEADGFQWRELNKCAAQVTLRVNCSQQPAAKRRGE